MKTNGKSITQTVCCKHPSQLTDWDSWLNWSVGLFTTCMVVGQFNSCLRHCVFSVWWIFIITKMMDKTSHYNFKVPIQPENFRCTWKNSVRRWRNRIDVRQCCKYQHFTGKLLSNAVYSSLDTLRRCDIETGKQEPKHVGAGRKPQVGGLESINPETAGWRSGCALQHGSEKQRFPCWCMLIRLEWAGPATACLVADLERRDYLLQLLSSPLLLLMPPLLKGQDAGSIPHSSQLGHLVMRCVTTNWTWSRILVICFPTHTHTPWPPDDCVGGGTWSGWRSPRHS